MDANTAQARELAAQPGRRRRGDVLQRAILAATLEQLQSVGYQKLTMEGVAAAAGTGKAALYRRWPGKPDLVSDALRDALPDPRELPLTDDVRADILSLLRCLRATADISQGAVFQLAKNEEGMESRFASMVDDRVLEPVRQLTLEVLRRGVARGELRPGAAGGHVADVGQAMLMHHAMTKGPDIPEEYLESVVDDVIMPMVTAR